jgi:fumarylacetoacetase
MPYEIDDTHDPKLESWVESANDPETDFPIQNLAVCVIVLGSADRIASSWTDEEMPGALSSAPCTLAVVIGDQVLRLDSLTKKLHTKAVDLDAQVIATAGHPYQSIGAYLARLASVWTALRQQLVDWLRIDGDPWLRENVALRPWILKNSSETKFLSPAGRDYTDFYASLHHATNVGSMFRPDNPLLPNYKHIPIAYHGRASTIVPSGTPIRRPSGQQAPAEEGGAPTFGPCKMLDYELEMGFVVGRGNEMGETIPLAEAEDHIFGLCLVNDWSARDIQKWEYQPLGPFLAKNFATTVSPYIVTMEALAPFRTPAFKRPAGDPRPLPYLFSETNEALGGIDITVEAWLASKQMRDRGLSPIRLSRGSFKDMYWTIAQMLTHHASGGCAMQPGDLLASGTISGPSRDARGCLLELTWDGDPWATPPTVVPGTQRTPIELPTGEKRVFLADGDEVILKAYCEREGFRRIGFGECRGVIEPAKT